MTDGMLELAPREAIDLRVDWRKLEGGVEVTGSWWSVAPEGPVLGVPGIRDGVASVRLEGVEPGAVHRVVNRVTTLCGLTAERAFLVKGSAAC